jgi:oligoendopeptidase F
MFGENGTEPFVFLNWDGRLESLFLFAHELAHAMHYLLAREAQPTAYARLSYEVAELPSFLNEVLLTEHLLASDRFDDGPVLDIALGRVPPLSPGRGAAFTRRVVTAVEAGEELTAEDITDHFRETGEAFFGPVTYGEGDGHGWLNLNLDRNPFHAVYYLLGRTAALAIARRLREGDLAAETYRAVLRAGDSAYPLELLETLDIDLESSSVVEAAGAEYGRLLDRR